MSIVLEVSIPPPGETAQVEDSQFHEEELHKLTGPEPGDRFVHGFLSLWV